MRCRLIAAAILAAPPAILSAGATITIVNGDTAGQGMNDPTPVSPVGGNTGTTLGEQRMIALQYAADIWGTLLDSPVAIRVRAHFGSLSCDATTAVLAQTGPTQAVSDFVPGGGFPGPEAPGLWYPVALANRRAGYALLPSSDDLATTVNSRIGQTSCGFTFYLGLDGQAGANVDLVAVMLHEYAHGFGFLTWVSLSNGAEALGGPDVFERFIYDDSSGKLWPAMTDAERAASAVNTGKVAFVGPNVTATAPHVLEGTPTLEVFAPAVSAGPYGIGTASFGARLTGEGVSGQLVAAEDPSDAAGAATTDACTALTNELAVAGRIALVDRGSCTFVSKALNAQAAGAVALVIADNKPEGLFQLGGTDPAVTIPVVLVTMADGAALRAALASGEEAKIFLDASRLAGTDGSDHVLLYAPNPLQNGSSISHWDTSAAPDLLMQPGIASDLGHGVDLTLPALRDLGWYPDIPARGPPAPVRRTLLPRVEGPRPSN
jgi:hypothetical protein